MNIIIVGAGKIGRNLAKSLADENNQVYLIEASEDVAVKAMEKLDVKVIHGSGTDPEILVRANVEEADLILAVTTSDETNLVVCSLASSYGKSRRIARVRNTALSQRITESGYEHFRIDEIINPEMLAAQSIVKTIEAPGTSEVADFADGRILLRAFDLEKGSPLIGQKVEEFDDEDFPWPFLIVAVNRKEEVLFPKGDTILEEEDLLYVLLPEGSLGEFVTFMDPEAKTPKKVIVYGLSNTGRYVSKALSGKIKNLIILEEDRALATAMAGKLEAARVINGSASEADILTECGVEVADVFVATTLNDHSNLISSVLAKQMGAKTTVICTQHPDYMSITNELHVDAIINPHFLAVEQILKLIRGPKVHAVAKLIGCSAEVVELQCDDDAPVTHKPLKDTKLPKNALIGAVERGDDIFLAKGQTQLQAGDKVVVFCEPSAINKLQELFTKK